MILGIVFMWSTRFVLKWIRFRAVFVLGLVGAGSLGVLVAGIGEPPGSISLEYMAPRNPDEVLRQVIGFLVPATAVAFLCAFVADARKQDWKDECWRCKSCGYNLTGLTGVRCPECGKKILP